MSEHLRENTIEYIQSLRDELIQARSEKQDNHEHAIEYIESLRNELDQVRNENQMIHEHAVEYIESLRNELAVEKQALLDMYEMYETLYTQYKTLLREKNAVTKYKYKNGRVLKSDN